MPWHMLKKHPILKEIIEQRIKRKTRLRIQRQVKKGVPANVTHSMCERKTRKTSGYFHVGNMFQQNQGQKTLELITGKHRFAFSKYKAETKDIILDKKKEREPFKSPKRVFFVCLFFLFLYKPLMRPCLEHCV